MVKVFIAIGDSQHTVSAAWLEGSLERRGYVHPDVTIEVVDIEIIDNDDGYATITTIERNGFEIDVIQFIDDDLFFCDRCGCLWDAHQSIEELYASDDPNTMINVREDPYGVVTCIECTDCYEERPTWVETISQKETNDAAS